MSIMVKDTSGAEREVATKSKTNAALALGIVGTALAGLNGGFGGILGGVNPATVGAVAGIAEDAVCSVSQKQFYETELANRDREFANYTSLHDDICSLAQRVAINETANTYQNILNDTRFEGVDKAMGWDRIATTYQIDAATCNKISGQLSLPLTALSNGFRAQDNYLSTYSAVPAYAAPATAACGGIAPYNYGGCGCGCY